MSTLMSPSSGVTPGAPAAAESPKSPFSFGKGHFLINFNCDAPRAFNLKTQEKPRVGYILSMKLKDEALTPDWGIKDPENPGNLLKVVSVLDYIGWSGKPTEPFILEGRMSSKNRSIFSIWKSDEDGGEDVSVNWVIDEYDTDAKQYYKAFHSEGKELRFVRTSTPAPTMEGSPEAEPSNPINYRFTLHLTPKTKGGVQTVSYCTSCSQKMSKGIGGEEGG